MFHANKTQHFTVYSSHSLVSSAHWSDCLSRGFLQQPSKPQKNPKSVNLPWIGDGCGVWERVKCGTELGSFIRFHLTWIRLSRSANYIISHLLGRWTGKWKPQDFSLYSWHSLKLNQASFSLSLACMQPLLLHTWMCTTYLNVPNGTCDSQTFHIAYKMLAAWWWGGRTRTERNHIWRAFGVE